MKSLSKTLIIILSIPFFFLACKQVETVSKQQLTEMIKEGKEPKVAIWYYAGTDEDFHYFILHDLDSDVMYRIATSEMEIKDRFPLTDDQKKWKVMSWGSQSFQKEKQSSHPLTGDLLMGDP